MQFARYLSRFAAPLLLTFALYGCGNNGAETQTGALSVRFSQGGQQVSPPHKAAADNIVVNDLKIVLGGIQLISTTGDTIVFKSDDPFVALLWGDGDSHDLGAIPFPVGDYLCTIYQIKQATVADTAIYNGFPELQDKSVYCAGYVDDADSTFEWASDLAFVRTMDHDTVRVRAGDTAEINFVIDPELWYDDGYGGKYDPRHLIGAGTYEKIDSNIVSTLQIDVL